MEPASNNTRFAMDERTVLMVQTRAKKPASLDPVEVSSSATMDDAFLQDGFVTLTTTVEIAVTNVPKDAILTATHALEPGSNATMDNASTTDGSAMEILTAAMVLTRIQRCAAIGQDAGPESLNALMATASPSLGFVMETMTAVTVLMRRTAHPLDVGDRIG